MLKLLAFAVVAAAAGPAQAAELAPYDASYEIRLIRASSTSGPRAVTGFYDYRVAETCEGWETKSHILVDLTFADDATFTNERFFTSMEARNGNTYRFAVQTLKNGNTVEAFKGTASLNAKGGQAIYEPLNKPAETKGGRKEVPRVTLALPPGTMLPMAHERALLQHAEQGDGLFRTVVLNGSYSSGPRVLSIAIGPRHGDHDLLPPGAEALDAKLIETPGWQLSSAAFNLNEKRDTPNFEMAIQFRESGISQYFEQTLRDYAIAGTLTRLKRLDPPSCG